MGLRGIEPRLAKRHSIYLQFLLICKEREGPLCKKKVSITNWRISLQQEMRGGRLNPWARAVRMAGPLRRASQRRSIRERLGEGEGDEAGGKEESWGWFYRQEISPGKLIPEHKKPLGTFSSQELVWVYQLINLRITHRSLEDLWKEQGRRKKRRKQHSSRAKVNQVYLIVFDAHAQPGEFCRRDKKTSI